MAGHGNQIHEWQKKRFSPLVVLLHFYYVLEQKYGKQILF